MTANFTARRLTVADIVPARRLFALMQEVFEEPAGKLSDAYLTQLLSRADFFALAAWSGEDIVGGLTAHCLPMTRSESSELMLYDLAVDEAHQRRGVGRLLVGELRKIATAAGIDSVFVLADDEDEHALDFYRAVGGAASKVTLFDFDSEP